MKILIVDDDGVLRVMTVAYLKSKLDCVIYSASNGQEGLDLTKQFNPDVVITDINMPVMDGFVLIQKLKKEGFPGLIIAISASDKNLQKAKDLGAHYILEKGIDDFSKIIGMIKAHF